MTCDMVRHEQQATRRGHLRRCQHVIQLESCFRNESREQPGLPEGYSPDYETSMVRFGVVEATFDVAPTSKLRDRILIRHEPVVRTLEDDLSVRVRNREGGQVNTLVPDDFLDRLCTDVFSGRSVLIWPWRRTADS